MDPKTGDIKAMVKKPDYNPNTPTKAIYPYYQELFDEYEDDDKNIIMPIIQCGEIRQLVIHMNQVQPLN